MASSYLHVGYIVFVPLCPFGLAAHLLFNISVRPGLAKGRAGAFLGIGLSLIAGRLLWWRRIEDGHVLFRGIYCLLSCDFGAFFGGRVSDGGGCRCEALAIGSHRNEGETDGGFLCKEIWI